MSQVHLGGLLRSSFNSIIIQATYTRHQHTAVLRPIADSSAHTPAINKPQNKPPKHHQASQKPNTSSPHPNQHTSPSPNSQPPTTACPHHSSQQMKKGKGRGERRATRNATPRSRREDYREARIPHSQQNAASKNTFNPEPPKNTIRVSPNRPNLPLP